MQLSQTYSIEIPVYDEDAGTIVTKSGEFHIQIGLVVQNDIGYTIEFFLDDEGLIASRTDSGVIGYSWMPVYAIIREEFPETWKDITTTLTECIIDFHSGLEKL